MAKFQIGVKAKEVISRGFKAMGAIEKAYPGTMNFITTLHIERGARAMQHEDLTPNDVCSAIKSCFPDPMKAKKIWWPVLAETVYKYIEGEERI